VDNLLPADLPIVQAPMAGGPSTVELAAAVATAGGFGYLAGGYLSPEALLAALGQFRDLAGGPVGVNLFVPAEPADGSAIRAYADLLGADAARFGAQLGDPSWDDDQYPGKVDALVDADVHTVSFTFGCPDPSDVVRLRAKGIVVAVTVTSAAEARHAVDAGADLLIVQGTEAGGHQASFNSSAPNDTALLDALAEVRAAADRPIVAAGGITTPHAAAAALQAGASAVQIGTALLCTPEAGTNPVYREALLSHRYERTIVTRAFSGRWARGLANGFALAHPDAPDGYPQVHHLTKPLRAAAIAAGDPEVPNLWAGTAWQRIRAEPAATIVRDIAAGL
jgi:nitronate monooxygenase